MGILYHQVGGDLPAFCYTGSAAGRATNHFSKGPYPKERLDFDDGANALWFLYGKEAKTHDEARFENLDKDMEGVLLFVRI